MSNRVQTEVYDHSRAKGNDRLVLLAIADQAHDDGVTWIQVETRTGKRSICSKCNLSRATAFRSIDTLVDLGELQVVKVRRGSSFINVYRVHVGRIIDVPVDYSRLPFELPYRFGERLNLRPSDEAYPASPDHDSPDSDNPGSTSQPETFAERGARSHGRRAHRLNGDASTVSSSRARVAKEGPLQDPTRIQHDDPEKDGRGEDQAWRASARLRDMVTGLKLHRRAAVCDECEVGGGQHASWCQSSRETTRQAYQRFIDEAAADPNLPLEEIRNVVETWQDIDDVERQELLERAETLRDPVQARKAAAA